MNTRRSKRQQQALERLSFTGRTRRVYNSRKRRWEMARPGDFFVNGRTAYALLQQGLITPYGNVGGGKWAYRLTDKVVQS